MPSTAPCLLPSPPQTSAPLPAGRCSMPACSSLDQVQGIFGYYAAKLAANDTRAVAEQFPAWQRYEGVEYDLKAAVVRPCVLPGCLAMCAQVHAGSRGTGTCMRAGEWREDAGLSQQGGT